MYHEAGEAGQAYGCIEHGAAQEIDSDRAGVPTEIQEPAGCGVLVNQSIGNLPVPWSTPLPALPGAATLPGVPAPADDAGTIFPGQRSGFPFRLEPHWYRSGVYAILWEDFQYLRPEPGYDGGTILRGKGVATRAGYRKVRFRCRLTCAGGCMMRDQEDAPVRYARYPGP